jgi:hypothetical protein
MRIPMEPSRLINGVSPRRRLRHHRAGGYARGAGHAAGAGRLAQRAEQYRLLLPLAPFVWFYLLTGIGLVEIAQERLAGPGRAARRAR